MRERNIEEMRKEAKRLYKPSEMYQVFRDDKTGKSISDELTEKYPIFGVDGKKIKADAAFVGNIDSGFAVSGTMYVDIKAESLENWKKIFEEIKKTEKWKIKQEETNKINNKIKTHLKATNTVYRGLGIEELESIAEYGGEIGHIKRDQYAQKMDFVSASITTYTADRFGQGVIVAFDVSEIDESDIHPMKYEYRGSIRVSGQGETNINPFEMFGGTHSIAHGEQLEVQMRNNSKPRIKEVTISNNKHRSRLEAIRKRLGYDFKTKYKKKT